MDHGYRRSIPLTGVVVLVAVLAAGCGSTTTTPSAPASAAPTASIEAPSAASTTATVSPTPSTATPSPTVAPSASAVAEDCPIAPQTGRLPSDRLVDVKVFTSGSADLVTFEFGNQSVGDPPQGPSDGSLETAIPPFTEAASGLPVDVTGEHVAQIRFSGMSLMNDVGEPTYDGASDFRPDLPALKTVVNYDMSEGVVGWYIGYDGDGCVTLTSDETTVVVAIDHPGS